MRVRKALLPDVPAIHGLIFDYSRDGGVLPRTLSELSENIRDFTVVEDRRGILGCGALHFYGIHLAEVRSITVLPRLQGRGIGRRLIDALLEEADQHRIVCICLFTRVPAFFARLGFRKVPHLLLPDKVYKDCLQCPRRVRCDEVAMIRGRLPSVARLDPARAPRMRRRRLRR